MINSIDFKDNGNRNFTLNGAWYFLGNKNFTLKGARYFLGHMEFTYNAKDHNWEHFVEQLDINKQVLWYDKNIITYQEDYDKADEVIKKYSYISSFKKELNKQTEICKQKQLHINELKQAREAILSNQNDRDEFIYGLVAAKILRSQ